MDDFRTQTFDSLTVRIDRAVCIGSGNCVNVAPEVFRLDDENLVTFVDDAEPESEAVLIEACSVCPVAALTVIDDDGEQIVP